jgi:tryptophan synthase alpha chain
MRLSDVFKHRSRPLLNIYFTAGYPQLDSLPILIKSLEDSGVDMVEIGIPYSDPLSDGPVIQNSSTVALQNGITLDLIFEQLEAIESEIPKIMMGYFNSVFQYGVERFCQKCAICGVEGVILPDLPIELYLEHYRLIFEHYDLSNIYLITPETSDERLQYIDRHSTSFIYAVSSSSTTGKKKGIQDREDYLKKLKRASLQNPLMLGFSISSADDLALAGRYVEGGIIGSAFINHIRDSKNLDLDVSSFVSGLRKKINT